MVVTTRSMTRKNSNVPSGLKKINTLDPKIVYRNFVISDDMFKKDVDSFYSKIENLNENTSVLKNFWRNTTVDIPDIPNEACVKLLMSLMDNQSHWNKLEETLNECVVPYEDFLRTPNIQTLIYEGQTQFEFTESNGNKVIVNLSPLKEFAFWIQMMTKLYVIVQRDLLSLCEKSTTMIEKSINAKQVFDLNISCHKFICHKYAFVSLRFHSTQIQKLIQFFELGLEFVLYAFGILCPEMVTEKFYPNIERSALYGLDKLAISEDDPVYGEAKKKFQHFY